MGRLVREKGVFDLLEAYGKLTPELRAAAGLVLVGEGTARAELARRASRIEPGRFDARASSSANSWPATMHWLTCLFSRRTRIRGGWS